MENQSQETDIDQKVVKQNERTAMAQKVTKQPDGPGLRIGKRAQLTIIANIIPGMAPRFRERLAQFQAEAAYFEEKVGTVQVFWFNLIDNDTRVVFNVIFDDDFKPYIADLAENTADWFDPLLIGCIEGFKGMRDPSALGFLAENSLTADFYYASNPDVSVRDITKMKKLSKAVNDLFDAVS